MRQGQSGKHVTISSKHHPQRFTGKIPFDWSCCALYRALTVLCRRTFPRGMHLQLFQTARKASFTYPDRISLWTGLRHNGRNWRQVLEAASMTADSSTQTAFGVFWRLFSFQTASNQCWLVGTRQAMPSFFSSHKNKDWKSYLGF